MHINPDVSLALKNLSRQQVEEKNILINERNAVCGLGRALNQATPDPAFVDSDDELVITIDAQANIDGSPTKAILKALPHCLKAKEQRSYVP
jgi:hypothetical protein